MGGVSEGRDAWGPAPGLPDEAYEHDGLITKRHVRSTALAFLRPSTGDVLWDLGAGSGSVSIEWARTCPGATAWAVERRSGRAERARTNVARMAPGSVTVVEGVALDLIDELPTPNAVFIGGGASSELISRAWESLRPGGRIVVHSVTLETESLLVGAYREHGGWLSRLSVEHAEPLGNYLAWQPTRPVIQWAAFRD